MEIGGKAVIGTRDGRGIEAGQRKEDGETGAAQRSQGGGREVGRVKGADIVLLDGIREKGRGVIIAAHHDENEVGLLSGVIGGIDTQILVPAG